MLPSSTKDVIFSKRAQETLANTTSNIPTLQKWLQIKYRLNKYIITLLLVTEPL